MINKINVFKTKENILSYYSINPNLDFIIWSGGVRFNEFGKSKLFNTLNNITPINPRGLNVNDNFTFIHDMNIYIDIQINKLRID